MINHLSISLNSKVVQSEGNISSDMDGEKVMLSISQGKYYNLGKTGGIIWDSIREITLVSELIQSLMAEYAVEAAECEQEVLPFLELLLREGLILTDEEK
jgi:hypothetical protein